MLKFFFSIFPGLDQLIRKNEELFINAIELYKKQLRMMNENPL